MSDGMGREFTYLSSHATNRYFIPNWGNSPLPAYKLLQNDIKTNKKFVTSIKKR